MGKGGGGTTSVSEPWGGVQPYLTGQAGTEPIWGERDGVRVQIGTKQAIPGIFPEASRLYGEAPLSPVMQQFAGLSPATLQAQQSASALAGRIASPEMSTTSSLYPELHKQLQEGMTTGFGGTPGGAGYYGQANELYKQLAGFNPNISTGQLGGFASGADPSLSGLKFFAGGGAGALDPSLSGMAQTASGAYLGSNPYRDAVIQQSLRPAMEQYQEAIAPSIQSAFAAGGRTGSGAAAEKLAQSQRELGRTMGDIASRIGYQDYSTERALQEQAQRSLGGQYLAGQQLGLSAAQALPGMQLQAASQIPQLQAEAERMRLAGLQSGAEGQRMIGGAYDAATEAQKARQMQTMQFMPQAAQMYQNQLDSIVNRGIKGTGLLEGIGGQQTAREQAILDAQRQYELSQQRAPWETLGMYNQFINPGAGGFTTTAQSSGGGGFNASQAIGAGTALYGLSAGTPYALPLSITGGLLGGL